MSSRRLEVASNAAFAWLATSAVVTPVCLPNMAAEFDTNLTEGGGFESARTAVIVIVLILTGWLALRLKKQTLLVAAYLWMGFGLVGFSVATSYAEALLAMILVGIGGGLSEALINPLVIDLHPQNSGRHLNLSNSFYPLGIVIAVVLFGELLTWGISWRLVFQLAALGCVLNALLFLVSKFPPPVTEVGKAKGFSAVLRQGPFWIFAAIIALGGAIESAITFWAASFIQRYYADLPRAGAMGIAVFAAAMTLGRWLVGRFSQSSQLRQVMLSSAAMGVVCSALIPGADSLWQIYVLLAVTGFSAACFWPSTLAVAAASMEVGSTMLFILLTLAGIAGLGVSPWLIGLVGDMSDLRTGFWVVPGLFLALFAAVLLERQIKPAAGH